jgi:catechol 2,3-dioxygenase-like lactoylglutathione lyase family enzyme
MEIVLAIPALPVAQITSSLAFYRDSLGFTVGYEEAGFAIVRRDAVEIHLWQAGDRSWERRSSATPVVSGAESFLAGTASCRVQVTDIDALHAAVAPLGVIHPNGQLADKPWGTREFAVLDPDNNLLTFFERRS